MCVCVRERERRKEGDSKIETYSENVRVCVSACKCEIDNVRVC